MALVTSDPLLTVSQAARLLGVGRRTFYNKLQELTTMANSECRDEDEIGHRPFENRALILRVVRDQRSQARPLLLVRLRRELEQRPFAFGRLGRKKLERNHRPLGPAPVGKDVAYETHVQISYRNEDHRVPARPLLGCGSDGARARAD